MRMFDENQMVTYTYRGKEITKKASEISRGSSVKLDVICDFCGATIKRTWSTQLRSMSANNVDACVNCRGKLISSKTNLSIDQVKEIFEKEGCKLLSTQYENSGSKLEYITQCGHKNTISLRKFRAGHGRICLDCHIKQSAKSMSFSNDYVIEYFADNNCKVLECNYKNYYSEIRYIAQCGHENVTKFSNFRNGKGRLCKECCCSGRNSSEWKGGITDLSSYLRSLLPSWREQQFKRANYTCEITGKTGNLNVHHMVSFANIRDITLEQLNLPVRETIGEYSDDELKLLTKAFLENNKNLSFPIVMLKSVHEDFHKFCGGKIYSTSFEQLKEFTSKYKENHSIAS